MKPSTNFSKVKISQRITHFRKSLLVLSAVKDGPGYPTWVFALEEERFAFAILESEDLAVASDVQLTLLNQERTSLV